MNKEKQPRFVVSVICMSFNHVNFITEAMDGFCMQQTNFPFVCTIIDDASTDGEQEVIRQYLQEHFELEDKSVVMNEDSDDYVLTFAQHKTNKNCYFAVIYLKYNHYSIRKSKMPYLKRWANVKYIALCEGDDYWTASNKLQKQVDFLEANPDYGMAYTNHQQYIQKTGELKNGYSIQTNFNEMLYCNRVCTLTTCFRRKMWQDYYKEINPISQQRGWLMGDYPLWLYIMANSKAKFLPDVTGVYRVLDNSASHFTSFNKKIKFIESTYDICLFFAQSVRIDKSIQKDLAIKEIESLVEIAAYYHKDIKFPLLSHLYTFHIFSLKKYVSAKMRFSEHGRKIYRKFKSLLLLRFC